MPTYPHFLFWLHFKNLHGFHHKERARLFCVPDLTQIMTFLGGDPVLTYTLLAAMLLAVVALGSGLLRLDVLAVLRVPGVFHLLAAVSLAFVLMLLVRLLDTGLTIQDTGAFSWSLLGGLRRFPLYVFALAYGPSAGLLAAGLFAAFETAGQLPGLAEAVFALELMLVGWLAIYPSPRQLRWAGPFNALLAYLLAWSTAGLALLQWQEGTVTLNLLWAQHQGVAGGLLISLGLLFFIGPRIYRDLFADARIFDLERVRHDRVGDVVIRDLAKRDARDSGLAGPKLPDLGQRRRRERRLDAPPDFDA